MSLENGIARYIHAKAEVDVYFPVDERGNAYINCSQCFYYNSNTTRCRLNGEVCSFPNKFVGGACPLEIIEED